MEKPPFHDGEVLIQEQVGEREVAILNGRSIATRIPAAARLFLGQQRICVLASTAADGYPWATFVTGPPGFASVSEDLTILDLAITQERGALEQAPALRSLKAGDPIGLLFIELATRRRLRINGSIARINVTGLLIAVQEAFPNCPKYIQRRQIESVNAPLPGLPLESGTELTDTAVQWIQGADTAFVASAHPDGRLDASHRGGNPGFVRIRDGVLLIPDYPGNSLFNTFGNFALNPRAGLTFLDFDQARQLQLTGEVTLHFGVTEETDLTAGTGRWWTFRPRRWIASPWNTPLSWRFIDASRFNPNQ
jgi:uncharacterized protein